MTATDYVIDILLIAVIFRMTRTHQLTTRSALLPLLLLAAAGTIYLRATQLHGNNLLLIVMLAICGAVLGLLSGFADKIWGDSSEVLGRATALSVVFWVLGMGFRLGFAYYAYHSGSGAVARFSVRHDITGAQAWTTALFLMAAGQVLARVGVLQIRRVLTPGAARPTREFASQQ